jgi:hypothetical protein
MRENYWAMLGTFGPAYQWNILNYGRLLINQGDQPIVFAIALCPAATQRTQMLGSQSLSTS